MRTRRSAPPLHLSRAEVMAGIAEESAVVATMMRGLSETDWQVDSRCAGWQVRDVAGLLTGLFTDVALGRMQGQGLPAVTQRQADERRDKDPGQLARELERSARLCEQTLATFDDQAWDGRAPGGFPGSLRRAVLVLWYELFVHGDDIRCAVSLEDRRGPGLRAAAAHLAETLGLWGWGPVTLRLDGIEAMDVRGGGGDVTADALEFVRVATGRGDPRALGLDETVNIYATAA